MMGTSLAGKWTATSANVQHKAASNSSSPQNSEPLEAEIVQPLEAESQK